MAYLLDSDICIFFLHGKYKIDKKIEEVGKDNCFASEITIAELKFGAANSDDPDKHRTLVQEFKKEFQTPASAHHFLAASKYNTAIRTATPFSTCCSMIE